MKKPPKNVREVALDILEAVEKQRSYSNLLLNSFIKKYQLKGPDTALLTEMVYGTIQRKMTLDYYLEPFIKKKLENWVRNLLRLSVYQMVYLDKIPDRAVIHEAVEIAKKRGHRGIAGLVNGVLRSIQRNGIPSLDSISDPAQRLAIATSHPQWLVERWITQYGLEKTQDMCEKNLQAPVQTARVNVLKTSREHLLELLEEEGLIAEPSPIIPISVRAVKGNLAHSKYYEKGYFTIQDESSMLAAYALNLSPRQKVLDACAAPGGKAAHIAEMLENTGEVIALDLHAHKAKLITEQANRLSLQNITVQILDSRKVNEIFPEKSFDRVLVDAPCSGLGVLRRKPDIKYAKTAADIYSLKTVQADILNATAKLVKTGGVLVYSTCTVDQEENVKVAENFLIDHPDFEPYPLQLPEAISALANGYYVQIMPQDFDSDGFFISSFRKKEE
ncbi:16S rRNA (cytosine967-C5)-methyltransferase [Bacillus thermophilus]|uniref:16S rRNA (cytosine(967)-C(5))-methyltransferase n=1 Tax=Siminovitchia thermophila TaxID=1245522 RepID=A0ABS2RAI1_9BACI|nr:16S rRNA (cytosine(967)-C(5))-methyltransferase RsmB [Siminovitchia thermophila]MBM7715621.1 16S rRNA (cytosine967-C5)-methyltransferase [Siminovitchia thermophila]